MVIREGYAKQTYPGATGNPPMLTGRSLVPLETPTGGLAVSASDN